MVMGLSLKAKKEAYIEEHGHAFERKVTHTHYTNKDEKLGKGKWSRILNKRITDNKKKLKEESLLISYVDQNYIQFIESQKIMPLILGGIFLLFLFLALVSAIKFPDSNGDIYFIMYSIFSFLVFFFFLYYYLTMPYKECIFNRKEGLITIPGAFWQANITMHIDMVKFIRSVPSAQGMGSHQLQIIRPMKGTFLSFYDLSLGNTCYEDLSFYLWYMDKNRPLPPGTAFDEFRKQDFEHRKAEGFPEPLFPSRFPTPEATPEQQATRREIGGW